MVITQILLLCFFQFSLFLFDSAVLSYSFQPHFGISLSTRPLVYRHSKNLVSLSSTKPGDEGRDVDEESELNTSLSKLYECLGAEPVGRFQIKQNKDGIRGLYLNSSVETGDVLLRVPLSSCLRDDHPPSWLDNHENMAWSTRLAACLLDIQHTLKRDESRNSIEYGHKIWWDRMLIPQKELLKQTLPIYWDESLLEYTNCRSLQLAVDAAYFSRAEALSDLNSFQSLVENNHDKKQEKNSSIPWSDKCQTALDFVQTRCCGVKLTSCHGDKHIRIMSPIFDLLNHASGERQNAEFLLEKQKNADGNRENDFLVVRSLRNINANDEVTISYGDENLNPWKCLSSYAFVPSFDESYATAEISINGVWGEVSAGTVPIQLIDACTSHQSLKTKITDDTQPKLTRAVAIHLANIGKETALMLQSDEDDETILSLKNELGKFEAYRLRTSQSLLLMHWSNSLETFAESFVN